MQTKELLECLKAQLEQGHPPFEQEVMVRLAGRDYALRRIDTSTSAIVLEAGEEVLYEDALPGDLTAGPGGPEGEGVEPPPPAGRQAGMASGAAPREQQER